jgi:ribonucleotide reductase alpha subunit
MYCSSSCFLQVFNRRKDVIDNGRKRRQEKRTAKREGWLKLYTQRRFELGRDLKKKEWEEYLKSKKLPWRFDRATFWSLKELKSAASSYNHRVISAEFDSFEDVYNITVEDNHNFGICLPVEVNTKSGKSKQNWIFTPQCGELWLSAYDCCCLGALVLPRFVDEQKKEIDWDLLRETVGLGQRFLDDVITVNNYPLSEIKDTASNLRRIGLGVMGLHDMLLMMGLRYNSDAGLELVDKVMAFVKNAAYEASVAIADKKGPFPKFEAEPFLKSGFVKTLRPSLRSMIKERGIRNCTLLTIAPTGTTSMVAGCSSGIEPMFAPAYLRKFRDGDALRTETVVHPLLRRFIEEGRGVKHFQGAHDLALEDHLEMQRICQKHLDSACSKTINLPQGTSEEQLSELYMEYFHELKGVTVYPEGSREDQPLTPLSIEDAIAAVSGSSSTEATSQSACRDGSCEI